MSESEPLAGDRIHWPSNGISEVPFRVYTDQATYDREQECLFQGPTWQYLCLERELDNPGDFVSTTVGDVAVIVLRDTAGATIAIAEKGADLIRGRTAGSLE